MFPGLFLTAKKNTADKRKELDHHHRHQIQPGSLDDHWLSNSLKGEENRKTSVLESNWLRTIMRGFFSINPIKMDAVRSDFNRQ